jgi:hypothetical protein
MTTAVRLKPGEKRDPKRTYHNQYAFEKWQDGREQWLKDHRSEARLKKQFRSRPINLD